MLLCVGTKWASWLKPRYLCEILTYNKYRYLIFKYVSVDFDGAYSLLVTAETVILKIPVDVSQTQHEPGKATVLISGKGND